MANKNDREDLILSDVDPETANTVRVELQSQFPHSWFFVYQDGRITASNEWGGALSESRVLEMIEFADDLADMLTDPETVRNDALSKTNEEATETKKSLSCSVQSM